jgi:hypothetical protein
MRSRHYKDNTDYILIVLLGAVGDAILASIVLKNIRACYPGSQIHWLILDKYFSVVGKNISDVDRWIIAEKELPRFDFSGTAYYYKQPQILKQFLSICNTRYRAVIKLIGIERDEILDIKTNYDGHQAECFLEACNRQLPITKDIRCGSYALIDEDRSTWNGWVDGNIDPSKQYICSELFARSAGKTISDTERIFLARSMHDIFGIQTIFMHAKSDTAKAHEFYNGIVFGRDDNPYIMCDLPLGAATYGVKALGRLFISYCTGQSWAVCATSQQTPILEIISPTLSQIHPKIGNIYNPFGATNITSLVTCDVNRIHDSLREMLS